MILDLGPARTETVALFTQFRCRLEFADLADELGNLDAEPDPAVLREKAEALLPERRQEPVDIVLCWDLLNYLQRPALTALMERIAARSRPGTSAHVLIVYSGTRMPAKPNRYAPLADGHLIELPTTTTDRAAPRYSPEDLRQWMRAYSVDSSMLLRNGMQEFLLRVL